MKSLIALGLLISSSVLANQADIDTIEAASMTMDSQTLIDMSVGNTGYIKALANYRLSIINKVNAKPTEAIAALSTTIQSLETLVENSPSDDEAWALLSQSYGLMISFQPSFAPQYSHKSRQAIDRAEDIDATNPRIQLFKGIMSFNTPAIYGGSKTKAIDSLNHAIKLFEDDRSSNNYWGEAETYVWLGLTYQALNDQAQAIANFKQALVIEPNFGWAKMLLKNNS